MSARDKIQALHDAASSYFETHDVPGEWLDADGSWKDWESESEGSAAEARRDTLAEVLAILDAETVEVFGEPMYSVRVGKDTADADTYAAAALALHTLDNERLAAEIPSLVDFEQNR